MSCNVKGTIDVYFNSIELYNEINCKKEMVILDGFKKYFQYAAAGCFVNVGFDNLNILGCQWVSCGHDGCCLNEPFNKIPCKYCGFWSGYGLDWNDIEYFCKRLESLHKI